MGALACDTVSPWHVTASDEENEVGKEASEVLAGKASPQKQHPSARGELAGQTRHHLPASAYRNLICKAAAECVVLPPAPTSGSGAGVGWGLH